MADLLAAESASDERAVDEEARKFLRELLADGPLAAVLLGPPRCVSIVSMAMRMWRETSPWSQQVPYVRRHEALAEVRSS